MNRKNTLILAILVNAGIFLLLFILVNRGHQDDQLLVQAPVPTKGVTRCANGDQEAPLTRRPADDPIRVLQDARSGDESEHYLEITVRRGDQLDRLAFGYNITEEEILRLNQLTSSQLSPGQILKIPLARGNAQTVPTAPLVKGDLQVQDGESVNDEEIYYIVKKGDSPWTIAQKHKIKLEELLRINDLDERKARRLREGDRLKVS